MMKERMMNHKETENREIPMEDVLYGAKKAYREIHVPEAAKARLLQGIADAKKDLEEFCLIPDLPGRIRDLADLHDEIYRTAGAKGSCDHGNLAGCPQVSMADGRLSVDLPAHRGTVIFVKN